MNTVRALRPYQDDRGNEIIYDGPAHTDRISVRFTGKNDRLRIAGNAKIISLSVDFFGDGGEVTILPTSRRRTGLRLNLRTGHRSRIEIGENVGTTSRAFISAAEGASVRIGDDCMIATGVEVRSDDAHPIYDVRTGRRVNRSASIDIGPHVWLAKNVIVFGGVTIGSGAVIGFSSIVTRNVPNNCVAVGAPARVVKRHIAWERPLLRFRAPGQDVPAKGEKSEQFWNMTEEAEIVRVTTTPPVRQRFAGWVRSRMTRSHRASIEAGGTSRLD